MSAPVQVSRTPALTRPATRLFGRRPRSAKARNRGKWGTGGAASYGDLGTGKGIGIGRRRDGTEWRGMPSEPIGPMDGEIEGHGARLDCCRGRGRVSFEREPPLRVENQRQERTERLEIGGANGIMRCRS
jgi:hypothetical protein